MGEFIVCLGVHNYKRWVDVVEDLPMFVENKSILDSYYTDAPGNRNGMLWKQLPEIEKRDMDGTDVHVKVTSETDNHFEVTITISGGFPF